MASPSLDDGSYYVETLRRSGGVFVVAGVEVRPSSSGCRGRGLVASRDLSLRQGDPVIFVPSAMLLSRSTWSRLADTTLLRALDAVPPDHNADDRSANIIGLLFLRHAAHTIPKHADIITAENIQDSLQFWSHCYVPTLPQDFMLLRPQDPESHMHKCLVGTSLNHSIRSVMKAQKTRFEELREALSILEEGIGGGLTIDLDAFLWASDIFTSRSFSTTGAPPGVIKDKTCIAPFIEFANHSNDYNLTTLFDDGIHGPGMYCYARYDGVIKEGQELFVTYGPRTNVHLMLYYGFALPSNPYDTVEFDPIHILYSDNEERRLEREMRMDLFKGINLSQVMSMRRRRPGTLITDPSTNGILDRQAFNIVNLALTKDQELLDNIRQLTDKSEENVWRTINAHPSTHSLQPAAFRFMLDAIESRLRLLETHPEAVATADDSIRNLRDGIHEICIDAHRMIRAMLISHCEPIERTFRPADRPRNNPLDELLWMSNRAGAFLPGLAVRSHPDAGLGVFAADVAPLPIRADTVLMSMPLSLTFTRTKVLELADRSPTLRAALDGFPTKTRVSEEVVMAVGLLYLRCIAWFSDNEAVRDTRPPYDTSLRFWALWAQTLPFDSPSVFSVAPGSVDARVLEQVGAAARAAKLQRQVLGEFRELKKVWEVFDAVLEANESATSLKSVSYNNYVWARRMKISRSFSRKIRGRGAEEAVRRVFPDHPDDNAVMCPILDFCNHSFVALDSRDASKPLVRYSATMSVGGIPTYDVYVERPSASGVIAPGDEITITYGQSPNTSLYMSYNFVIPGNPHDYFTVPLTAFKYDTYEAKSKVISAMTISDIIIRRGAREEQREDVPNVDEEEHDAPQLRNLTNGILDRDSIVLMHVLMIADTQPNREFLAALAGSQLRDIESAIASRADVDDLSLRVWTCLHDLCETKLLGSLMDESEALRCEQRNLYLLWCAVSEVFGAARDAFLTNRRDYEQMVQLFARFAAGL